MTDFDPAPTYDDLTKQLKRHISRQIADCPDHDVEKTHLLIHAVKKLTELSWHVGTLASAIDKEIDRPLPYQDS